MDIFTFPQTIDLSASRSSPAWLLRELQRHLTTDVARTRRVSDQSRELVDQTSRFATTFRLVGHLGESIHPVRIKNRNTGNIAFVLAPRGAGTHKRKHAIEVSDEAKAYEMVRSGTFKIRATRHAKEPASLLGLGDRVSKAS